jgi:hypothetical protein
MSTALAPVEKTASKDADSLVVSFPVTEQQLAEIKQTLTGLTVEKDGYETVRKGIASTRELRGRVEARRSRKSDHCRKVAKCFCSRALWMRLLPGAVQGISKGNTTCPVRASMCR